MKNQEEQLLRSRNAALEKELSAKNRDLEIEASLERVRARTMAMQKSDELAETVSLLFKQLLGLGIRTEQIRTCGIVTFQDNEPLGEQWITETNGEIIPQSFMVRYDEVPAYKAIYKGWKAGEQFMVIHLEGEKLREHLGYLAKGTNVPTRDVVLPQQATEIFNHVMFFSQGCLFIITKEALPGYHAIFKRFGAVFQQSYTRFLDLQKAEGQAREGQIQLALERVRARTMAMQNSDELAETVYVLFQQFRELGENPDQATIGIINEPEGVVEYRVTMHGSQINKVFKFSIDEPIVTNRIYKAWKAREKSLVIDLTGQELYDFTTYRASMGGAGFNPAEKRRVINVAFFSKGIINVQSNETRSAESLRLLERFAGVFESTYTRFLDLKKAEAQAREAQIEAALERVRSRAMAMQKSEDLAHAVAIVFEELDKLNLSMLRCGIGILDKERCSANVWTTTKSEGETVVQVSGDEPMNIHPLLQHAFDAWAKQEEDCDYVLQGEDLNNFYRALTGTNFKLPDSQSIVTDTKDYKQYYYVAPFHSGNLYAFRETEFTSEAKTIVKRFANVFDFTYTRFNDLKIAEAHAIQAERDMVKLLAEKKRAEEALTELKAAQARLIQSEKMASLGELTAGIAHEIQNPLNFVNNFSEVSVELLDEMDEELDKGDIQEAKAIGADLKQNLEKIRHHGKRADGIVKGMLEHSRSHSGQKELVDLNALADEYMRLSYHGLRAKDKSFNAEMLPHFDTNLPKINVIPQDIGRVLLNLFNNAFYAVNLKKKTVGAGYSPEVTVTTSTENGQVIISVKDNGAGIPDAIKEKIMQPFFTTKPTGEGTGLGLSLTYDMVVKGHGGKLEMESKEGEYTQFTVALPLNS